jgi:hypothetical protein
MILYSDWMPLARGLSADTAMARNIPVNALTVAFVALIS